VAVADPDPRPGATEPSGEELDELRRRLERAVLRTCPSWLRASVADIVQVAVLKVVEHKQREGIGEVASSYLWRVAHSTVVDEIRRRRRRREDPLEEEVAAAHMISPDPDPERHERARQLGEGIATCLRGLVAARRQAVALYLLGHRVPELARLAGWPDKRAENLVFRGLADLRGCLRGKGLAP
jgi:RNA polymerase sigma-70 factor (ECF subfamily)